jgi:hypothetical protein
MNYSYENLTPIIGAQARGVDLAQMDDGMAAWLRDTLAKRKILIFRDQQLDREAHKRAYLAQASSISIILSVGGLMMMKLSLFIMMLIQPSISAKDGIVMQVAILIRSRPRCFICDKCPRGAVAIQYLLICMNVGGGYLIPCAHLLIR